MNQFLRVWCCFVLILGTLQGCGPQQKKNSLTNQKIRTANRDAKNRDRKVGEAPEPDINARTHYAAGRLLEGKVQFDKAIQQYRLAIAKDPEFVEVHNRLGVIYGLLDMGTEAEASLKRALELVPDSCQLVNNLGFEYLRQKRFAEAETQFRASLKIDPTFIRARGNLAVSLAAQQKFKQGLAQFKLTLPETDALYNLGLAYKAHGRYGDARRAFKKVLGINPDFEAAAKQLDNIPDDIQDAHKPGLDEDEVKLVQQLAPDPDSDEITEDWAQVILSLARELEDVKDTMRHKDLLAAQQAALIGQQQRLLREKEQAEKEQTVASAEETQQEDDQLAATEQGDNDPPPGGFTIPTRKVPVEDTAKQQVNVTTTQEIVPVEQDKPESQVAIETSTVTSIDREESEVHADNHDDEVVIPEPVAQQSQDESEASVSPVEVPPCDIAVTVDDSHDETEPIAVTTVESKAVELPRERRPMEPPAAIRPALKARMAAANHQPNPANEEPTGIEPVRADKAESIAPTEPAGDVPNMLPPARHTAPQRNVRLALASAPAERSVPSGPKPAATRVATPAKSVPVRSAPVAEPAIDNCFDFDRDTSLDLLDYAGFQTCFNEPAGQLSERCKAGDMDEDGDVDLADFRELYRLLDTSGCPF